MDVKIYDCEQLIIDFAKEKNLEPSEILSKFQTALLNIAGYICRCCGYSDEEYEHYMKEYADNIRKSVDRRFRKEK